MSSLPNLLSSEAHTSKTSRKIPHYWLLCLGAVKSLSHHCWYTSSVPVDFVWHEGLSKRVVLGQQSTKSEIWYNGMSAACVIVRIWKSMQCVSLYHESPRVTMPYICRSIDNQQKLWSRAPHAKCSCYLFPLVLTHGFNIPHFGRRAFISKYEILLTSPMICIAEWWPMI